MFLNGWTYRDDRQARDEDGELARPAVHPGCARCGARSSQPGANWVPWRRGRW